MRGRRPEKTGGVFAGIHSGFFRAENDADGRRSFAAVVRPMPDRLLWLYGSFFGQQHRVFHP
jgi:hypothetical protein